MQEVRRESQERFISRIENDVCGSQNTALETNKYLNRKEMGLAQIKLTNEDQWL